MLPNIMIYENFHFYHLASFRLWAKMKIAFVDKYLLRLCVQNELCHRIISYIYFTRPRNWTLFMCDIAHQTTLKGSVKESNWAIST